MVFAAGVVDAGDDVRIAFEFADNGAGMDADVVEKGKKLAAEAA